MGCDIHGFIEYKTDKEFLCFGKAEIDRNYSLFKVLAGVKDFKNEQIFEVKKLPADLSKDVFRESYDGCAENHHHSHITFEDFLEHIDPFDINSSKWETNYNTFLVICNIMLQLYVVKELKKIEDNKNIRLVFWFDN